ncbi:MAG: endonuclease [Bacteroidetes bacterium]|nr:endonuclease [Bacteroidota bacterium]
MNICQTLPIRLRALFFLAGLSLFFLTASGGIPPGYYNLATGQNGEALQIALYNIIKDHVVVNYTPGVWDAFYSTDPKPNGKVWDMYSDVPGGTPPYEYTFGMNQCGTGGGGVEGDCYSREHSFPKSWFDDTSPMNTDLFHIFPTDQYVNNMHSNYPFAVVETVTKVSQNGCKKGICGTIGYSGIVFEPIDEYKGDFARAYFYMATRYENVISTWYSFDIYADAVLNGTSYPAFETWYLNMLITWHNQDPVSAKELARNDSVYEIQHNRNPFIDHPEYVDSVWMPSGPMPEPANHVTNFTATTGIPAYSALQLSWTDATGSVTPAGYLIRGSAVGYSSIVSPVDGIPVSSGGLDKNIGQGVQSCTFSGLLSNKTYYFKIFPYTNAGNTIDYKTSEPVPAANDTTTSGISVLQAGDIAIIEYASVNPDKLSFITFKQLNAGTVINFTDNSFISPTTVRTGEGVLTYIAQTVIPAGTVVSWYSGIVITGTEWSFSTSTTFSFAESGDQLFAYQGTWGTNQSLICGLNAGNSGWITTGPASANLSYFPSALTNEVNSLTFTKKNGNYNLISSGSANVLGSLVANPVNWTRSDAILTTPSWSFSISNSTIINQNATVLHLPVGGGEIVTVQPGIVLTVTGNTNIN